MESKENVSPADTEADCDTSGGSAVGEAKSMAERLDKYLDTLASVRRPGKGGLTLAEAMTAAVEQATAYEQWCQFGAPPGVIEVWVEAQRVMSVQPGDATDLKGVLFETATVPKAVVQVVRRADEVADTVVLLNRELTEVLCKGGECDERLPNNQTVRLKVKSEGRGQLSFWVEFCPVGATREGEPRGLKRLKRAAATAGACLRQQFRSPKTSWGVPALGMASAMAAFTFFAGLIVLVRPQAGARGVESAVRAHEGLRRDRPGSRRQDSFT